jgi:hypothetical protein
MVSNEVFIGLVIGLWNEYAMIRAMWIGPVMPGDLY